MERLSVVIEVQVSGAGVHDKALYKNELEGGLELVDSTSRYHRHQYPQKTIKVPSHEKLACFYGCIEGSLVKVWGTTVQATDCIECIQEHLVVQVYGNKTFKE